MATMQATARDRVPGSNSRGPGMSELDALQAENKELRELVVRLSEIVVRNVLDRKTDCLLPRRVAAAD